jgi:hypothetical protein
MRECKTCTCCAQRTKGTHAYEGHARVRRARTCMKGTHAYEGHARVRKARTRTKGTYAYEGHARVHRARIRTLNNARASNDRGLWRQKHDVIQEYESIVGDDEDNDFVCGEIEGGVL